MMRRTAAAAGQASVARASRRSAHAATPVLAPIFTQARSLTSFSSPSPHAAAAPPPPPPQQPADSGSDAHPTQFPLRLEQARGYADRQLSRSGGLVACVFGPSGQIGRYVVGRLGRVGAQIMLPHRGEERAVRHLKVVGEVGQTAPVRFGTLKGIRADKDRWNLLQAAVDRSNVVVNLIGRNFPTRNFTLDEANADSAAIVAELCANSPSVERLVHVSCVGAAEDHPSEMMRAKWKGEQVVRQTFPQATIVRATQVFGPEDRLLNKFGFLLSLTHKWMPLLIDPEAFIQPISVRDVATCIMSAIGDPDTRGLTYDLGGPDVLTVRQLCEDVIFRHGKASGGRVVPVPPALALPIANFLGRVQRKPMYSRDEVHYYKRDNIVREGALTCKDLGLDERIALDDVAVNLLRNYRDPSNYFDLVNSKHRGRQAN